ncbi:hypothetical protein KQX54_017400 [Cotesia glomerata]|uniref:Uncharacterized protein n=1 Tax=Cotesia glomerata TaxID=32391 RepID=A0AAV7I0R4_COTGL|nr:hypothetical protein KQX54_017400 [Cotesia glomerata]
MARGAPSIRVAQDFGLVVLVLKSRVVSCRQSAWINALRIGLRKFISVSSDSASERNGIKVDTRVREMSSGRRDDSTRGREENVREAEEDRVESYRRVKFAESNILRYAPMRMRRLDYHFKRKERRRVDGYCVVIGGGGGGGGFAPAGAEKQKRKRYFESARHVLRIFHAREPVKSKERRNIKPYLRNEIFVTSIKVGSKTELQWSPITLQIRAFIEQTQRVLDKAHQLESYRLGASIISFNNSRSTPSQSPQLFEHVGKVTPGNMTTTRYFLELDDLAGNSTIRPCFHSFSRSHYFLCLVIFGRRSLTRRKSREGKAEAKTEEEWIVTINSRKVESQVVDGKVHG